MTDLPQNILVLGPAWVGDMVMAQSLLRHLHQYHPQANIDVMAPVWSLPLIARMPEVRDAIEMPFKHGEFKPLARIRWGKNLKSKNYDWAIVLPYTWKAALVPFGAGIRRRTGFMGEQRWGLLNDIRPLNKTKLPMMVERYVALGLDKNAPPPSALLHPQLVSTKVMQAKTLTHLKLDLKDYPIAAFCPGAEYGPAKRWPPAYFAEVGKRLTANSWKVVLLGSGKDRDACDEIENLLGEGCINLAGDTKLEEAIDLLAMSRLVLTNDSGLMHIAAAVNVPVFALYGSSDPRYTPPLTDKAHIISNNIECSPCFKKTCPLGHTRCLKELMPGRVIGEIAKVADFP